MPHTCSALNGLASQDRAMKERVLFSILNLAGIPRASVDDRFWRRRSYQPHPDDVILRTAVMLDRIA